MRSNQIGCDLEFSITLVGQSTKETIKIPNGIESQLYLQIKTMYLTRGLIVIIPSLCINEIYQFLTETLKIWFLFIIFVATT